MPTRRVLVVSAELGTRQGISEVLAGRDFDVRSCAGGAEALEQLDESPADLVLSKLGPRGADGVALLGEIRERHPGVPIVFIVEEGEPELAERALEAGADDFVARPLSAPLLIARIENTLDATRLRRRIEQLELDRLSPGIVAASPSMIAILDKLPVVAQNPRRFS